MYESEHEYERRAFTSRITCDIIALSKAVGASNSLKLGLADACGAQHDYKI